MPRYEYKVRDKDGRLHSGAMEAVKQEAVADQLRSMGFIPVQIEERREASALSGDILARFKKVGAQEIIVFSRQLATLMSAGVSFIQSLNILERQTENARLKQIISDIRRDVEGGGSFSDALSRHPKAFSNLYVSMVRAGETAGILDDILNRLALLAEHEMETRARVKAAVRYPMIVVVAISVAFAFLVSFVIPKFTAIFARFKTALPLPTRILIGINNLIQNYWFIILPAIILVVAWVVWYVKTPVGRRHWDGLKLRLPIFGTLFQKVALSRFARVFSSMQKSGLSMMLILEIVAETVGNVVIARAIENMRESLRQGRGLIQPMEASGLFPPLVVQMVAVGEETGAIDTMLNKVSDYYDMDVDYTLRNLSTMIEPVLLLFVGGMVLLLALGIFLPMWDMISLFRK